VAHRKENERRCDGCLGRKMERKVMTTPYVDGQPPHRTSSDEEPNNL
jgi:hypothetical protein